MANTKNKLKYSQSFWLLVDRLHQIGNATRYKTETTDLLRLDEIDDAIMSIEQTEEQHETYEGPTIVTPKFESVTLSTENKALDSDILVRQIEVTTVSNTAGGNTLII